MNDQPELSDLQQGNYKKAAIGCGGILLAFIVWAIVGALFPTFLQVILRREFTSMSFEFALATFIYTSVAAYFSWRLFNHPNPLRIIGLIPDNKSIHHWLSGLLFGASGVALAVGVIAAFGSVTVSQEPIPSPDLPKEYTYPWLAAIITLGMFAGQEEVFIRGFLYPAIKRTLGFMFSLILSSLVFSILHLMNPGFVLPGAIDIFLAGIFLGLLRELTGNLFLAWGAHFGWNFALAAFGLNVSGLTIRLVPMQWHLVASGPDWLTGGAFGPEGGLSGIAANIAMVIVSAWLVILKNKRHNPLRSRL